ncbi:MAG: DUF4469 domain-containing protein [Dysgonamonadaceae bacterium]|jgi:hypothetical protein|nr:DUF4469 domain-containing protein [Dysgonamonadaceae bacterium]
MTNILHHIRAYLYENPLTKENLNDFIARVDSEVSLTVKDIAESAALRGGADVSAATMEHATNLWLKEMAYRLCDGFSINAGWFTASVHIKGTFDSPTEHFNPDKHRVLFEFHQGAELRRELSTVTVEVLGLAESGTVIAQVTDMRTGSVDNLLTPDRNLRITGQKIKVVGDEPGVGILFRSVEDPDAIYRVDPADIIINNPSEVIIVIPMLIPDTYRLEITTQFANDNRFVLKQPRTAVFNRILTVTQ